MLVEVKAKVTRIIDGKTRKRTENFLKENCEFFTEAEHAVTQVLNEEQRAGTVADFEIISLKQSGIKEVFTGYQGDNTYIVSFKDIFLTDDGTEKPLRYKVLLWANDLAEAMQNARQFARQGYDMVIEGIKEQQYEYLTEAENGEE